MAKNSKNAKSDKSDKTALKKAPPQYLKDNVHSPLCVTCHMSCVRRQVSCVRCQVSHVTFLYFCIFNMDKVVDLVSGGSIINGATLSSFLFAR